ncbi:MAG: hypothetical protein E7410_00360 [Ruminococcaceae bacterium]|nr:hypothetical protein [Oscillospiraceae bacterium]
MKKAFASETAFKIYSLLIAILLWVFVVYNQNPQSTKVVDDIKISYTNAAELERAGLIIRREGREPTVAITVEGRRLSIGKIESENVSASVTVPRIHEGEYDVSVETRLPISDVSIIDKKPYTVKVVVEKLKKISVPVEIKYTGSPKDENSSVQAQAVPEQVSVWGPESVMNNVSHASATFDISNAVEGQTSELKYKIISKDGKDITNDANVNVDSTTVLVVSSVYKIKDIPIEVKYTGNLPEGYAIASSEVLPAKIRLGSKDNAIDMIEKIATEPIDVSGMSQSKKLSVRLVLPDGIANILSVTEAEVSVNVVKKVSRTVNVESVVFKNAKEDLSYQATNLPMQITLYGAKSILDAFEIAPSVDVGELSKGEHYTLPLELNLPEGIICSELHNVVVNVF